MAIWLPKALVKADLARNTEEAKEMLAQGLVKLDGEVITDQTCILRAGHERNGVKPTVIFEVGEKSVEYLVPISK